MRFFTVRAGGEFELLGGNGRSQAAVMVLNPGESTGGPVDPHTGDQWVFVLGGEGEAVVEGVLVSLRPGMLLLVEAGERHEVRAGGLESLVTLGIYAPPQYKE